MENVSFKGYENYGNYGGYGNYSNPFHKQVQQTKPVEEDEGMSTAAKMMIGATALAGVIALGVAGYKGHLGKDVQNLLKGAEKAAEEGAAKGEKAGEKAGEEIGKNAKAVKIPKNLEYKIVKTNGIYRIKVPAEIERIMNLSAEELEHFEKINIDGIDCRILSKHKNGKPKLIISEGKGFIEEYDKKTGLKIRSYENYINTDGTTRLSYINEYDKEISGRVTKTCCLNSEGEVNFVKECTKFDDEGRCIEEFSLAADGKTKIDSLQTSFYDDGSTYSRKITNYSKNKRTTEYTEYVDSGVKYEVKYYPDGKHKEVVKRINSDGSFTEEQFYKNGGSRSYIEVDESGNEIFNESYPKVRFRKLKKFFEDVFSSD